MKKLEALWISKIHAGQFAAEAVAEKTKAKPKPRQSAPRYVVKAKRTQVCPKDDSEMGLVEQEEGPRKDSEKSKGADQKGTDLLVKYRRLVAIYYV